MKILFFIDMGIAPVLSDKLLDKNPDLPINLYSLGYLTIKFFISF